MTLKEIGLIPPWETHPAPEQTPIKVLAIDHGYEPDNQGEVLRRFEAYTAKRQGSYSLADALRITGRVGLSSKSKPLVRAALDEDGIADSSRPKFTAETLRKICLRIGLPNPKLSEAKKGKYRRSFEPLPEGAVGVQLIIADFLQNHQGEIPGQLVEKIRGFYTNDPRESYPIGDVFKAAGKKKSKARIRMFASMVETAGIKRPWKNAPLAIPIDLAVASAFKIGLDHPKQQKRPRPTLFSDVEAQQLAQGDTKLLRWLQDHKKAWYCLTDVARALGYKNSYDGRKIIVRAGKAAQQLGVTANKHRNFLDPPTFAAVYRRLLQPQRLPPDQRPAATSAPVSAPPEQMAKVDQKLILDDARARELGAILQQENWHGLESTLPGVDGNLTAADFREIYLQYQSVLQGRRHIPDNQAMRDLADHIIPAFAAGNRQAIIAAQKSEAARLFLQKLANIPQQNLLALFAELRFRFITSR